MTRSNARPCERAQRRMIEAEEKLQRVKKWGPVFQHAVTEYQARGRPTGDMLGSDLRGSPRTARPHDGPLDAYVAMAPPSFSNRDEATSTSVAETTTEPLRTASMADPREPAEPGPQASSTPKTDNERPDDQSQSNPPAGE